MIIDGQVISTILIAAGGILVWINTQTQARSRSQRAELRHRRAVDVERIRRISDLEETLAQHRINLPATRRELTMAEDEDW